MKHPVHTVSSADYPEIITLWEASVRATHDFLTEEWISRHKPLILHQYLDMVELRCVKDHDGNISGFVGTADGNIEMLFVHPESFGKKVGTALLRYAVELLQATKVDVNEQNPGACRFCEKAGFEVTGRSALDGQGNPYPLLHMTLKAKLT
jgi:putative acetyltransferase